MREIMKNSQYDLIPLHKRPDLLQQCCNLLNSEWKRSETARLRSLTVSCDNFPTCFLLLENNKLLGHCKVSAVPDTSDSVFIESFIIDHAYRSQGLGSMLLCAIEDYIHKNGINTVYLTTKGQEGFYSKNGYTTCEPVESLNGFRDFNTNSCTDSSNDFRLKSKEIISAGPPPPPMPTNLRKSPLQIYLTTPARTFMKKTLSIWQ